MFNYLLLLILWFTMFVSTWTSMTAAKAVLLVCRWLTILTIVSAASWIIVLYGVVTLWLFKTSILFGVVLPNVVPCVDCKNYKGKYIFFIIWLLWYSKLICWFLVTWYWIKSLFSIEKCFWTPKMLLNWLTVQ